MTVQRNTMVNIHQFIELVPVQSRFAVLVVFYNHQRKIQIKKLICSQPRFHTTLQTFGLIVLLPRPEQADPRGGSIRSPHESPGWPPVLPARCHRFLQAKPRPEVAAHSW